MVAHYLGQNLEVVQIQTDEYNLLYLPRDVAREVKNMPIALPHENITEAILPCTSEARHVCTDNDLLDVFGE